LGHLYVYGRLAKEQQKKTLKNKGAKRIVPVLQYIKKQADAIFGQSAR
jgi:hypothetical protein